MTDHRVLANVLAAVLLFAPGARTLPAAALAPVADSEVLTYSGTATLLNNRGFLYGEKHVLLRRNGKIAEREVLYTCRDGSAFARKSVVYVDPLAPNFVFEDASNGMLEGVRSDGEGREVFFRAGPREAEKIGALPAVPALVVDAGFDEFVHTNWPALLAGRSIGMNFLVPSRLHDIGFRVRHQGRDRADGVPVEVFRLNLAGILGWILPGIDVYYDAREQVLMRYVGLSDLRDAAGDSNLKVDVSFHPGDRSPADLQDLERAKRARLKPCK